MSHSSILTSDPLLSASELDLRRVNISALEAAVLRLRLQPFRVMGAIETVICVSRLLILSIFVEASHEDGEFYLSDSEHSTGALTRPRSLAFCSLIKMCSSFLMKTTEAGGSGKVENTISQRFIYIFSVFRHI